jgi:hypothetical protein
MAIPEISWKKRLAVIDFEVVRVQLAREAGVDPSAINEVDVRRRMTEIYELDERDARSAHPEDFRPKRVGK